MQAALVEDHSWVLGSVVARCLLPLPLVLDREPVTNGVQNARCNKDESIYQNGRVANISTKIILSGTLGELMCRNDD